MTSISMSHTSLAPTKLILHHQSSKSASSTLLIVPRPSADTHLTMPAILQPQTQHCPQPKTIHLAADWRYIQGANDWHNLINPLSPLLCDELIRYGEFVTACYTAFDLDSTSKTYHNCKYSQSHILHSSGLFNSGYQVTKYIYSTAHINMTKTSTSWVGFVAVSTDNESRRLGRRDVLVCFRGTVTTTEWIANLMSSLTPAQFDPDHPRKNVMVEMGFLNLYTSEGSSCKFTHESCRQQLLSELKSILIKYRSEEMSITLAGHSMGSSLALLLGYDLAELELNRDGSGQAIPITVFSFGGPRVGNAAFKERCDELGVKVLRVVNVGDPVTKMPGVLMNEGFRFFMRYEMPWSCSCYAHVGVEMSFDWSFEMGNPRCVHDLETYLRLLKCTKKVRVGKKVGLDVVGRVREWVGMQKFGVWPWMDAARQVGNLVQSIGFRVLVS